MPTAGTVTVDFAAETAKFTAELKKVNASLQSLEVSFGRVGRFARQFLPVLSVATVTAFTRQMFLAADALGDTAAQIGVSVESLSRLKFAAEQNDVEFAALSTSLTRFQRTLSDATSGGREAASSFAQIGISAAAIRDLSLEDQLAAVAAGFQNVVRPADQTRLAMELFGRSGAQLLPFLREGPERISELTAEADRLGITMSASTAAGIDATDKALKKLSATTSGFFTRRLGGLALSIFGSDDELVNMQRRIEALTAQRDAFLASSQGTIPTGSGLEAELQRINAELAVLEPRFRSLNALRSGAASTSAGGRRRVGQNEPLLQEVTVSGLGATQLAEAESGWDLVRRFNQEAAEQNRQMMLEITQEQIDVGNQLQLEAQRDLGNELNNLVRQQLEERVAIEDFYRGQRQERDIATEEGIANARRDFLNAGISALQTFAGQSKKAAIALVVINKARSIAEAIQNTAVGVTNQLRSGDPYTAIPRAVAVGAFGALQVAAIAASGYGQVQAIQANGGAPLGSPANPVFTTAGEDGGAAGASSQSAVQVVIQGNVFSSRETADWIIAQIQEAVTDRDVVLIQNDSRQAQDLLA